MKIAYISGVKFGLELLQELVKSHFPVSVVFSYDDTKKKFYSDFASFDDICEKHRIKHVKVHNINDESNIRLLRDLNPDVILVMGWSQLLKNEIIRIPKLGVIGSHPTELPKYRGRAPIPWSLIKGLKESALTFFYIEEGVDNGDILDQQKFSITPEDDASSLYNKVTDLGKQMIVDNLKKIQQGNITKTKQDESKFIECWPKRTPHDGLIDWSNSAKEIHTLIRATTHPYPGAFSYYNDTKIKIFSANFTESQTSQPGRIVDIGDECVIVGTGNGTIILKKIQIGDDPEISPTKFFSKNDVGKYLAT